MKASTLNFWIKGKVWHGSLDSLLEVRETHATFLNQASIDRKDNVLHETGTTKKKE